MIRKIDGWLDKAAAVMLRAAAMFLGACGALFLLLTAYIAISLVPEMVVAFVIGGALTTASLWLWKKANKIRQ